MGAPIGKNLAKNDFDVLGFEADNSIKLPEITMIPSITTLVKKVDIVFTILRSGSIVNKFNPKITSIDCSTINVKTTKEVCQTLSKNKIHILNAQESCDVPRAKFDSLMFMVGGSKNHFDKLRFLFEYMGCRSVYFRKNGNGQTAKICNNMIFKFTMIALCEALTLADKLELDR